ncbi:hypothetical protein CSUB01_03181 [Colletotrichum sublineola]|uniref:SET domain-containing protein n=1 Tax=Colletotrichum sublineola TaxID=1173701 RepID=A0A066WYB4_COLSU|nr:hypothetical protein CSUB01_03181 [Colletotrichum sublineola]
MDCLICFKYSCEHGEYDGENYKKCFSIDAIGMYGHLLEASQTHPPADDDAPSSTAPCKRRCYLDGNGGSDSSRWEEPEILLLQGLARVLSRNKVKVPAACLVATILDKNCCDAQLRLGELVVSPNLTPLPQLPETENLPCCGAVERANPSNTEDEVLFQTGCQNCSLQRGKFKNVTMGKSRLEGCGYGLFTIEDIAKGDFVIEYTGEIITSDEGTRREARHALVDNWSCYKFSLLEKEGIWLDAARYGNCSRYINHSSDDPNITPVALYVSGDFRISFRARRNIQAGEELFFNYGNTFFSDPTGISEAGIAQGCATDLVNSKKRKRPVTGANC